MSCRDKSFILLNVAKTKDTTIDFRESSSAGKATVIIKGEEIELVEYDKYLGTVLDKKLFKIN